ncbi:MAG: DegV family protein [Anaerolineales bacterium]|nr:DegV family protein [Anaerolineales bacterium]
MPARVRLVTDSNCDIPPDLVRRHALVVVPSILHISQRAYRDGVELSRAEFYQRLPSLRPPPTTAAPSAGEFEAAYRAAGDGPVVGIFLAAAFSGLCDIARLGAEAFGERVSVVDSGSVSLGLGFQVLAAAEAAERGATVTEVLAVVRSVQRRLRLIAALDTVEYLRRGGRAGAITAGLSHLLQIKPLLEVSHSQVQSVARVRTRAKAHAALVERVAALAPLERLAVLHTAAPEDALALAERLAPLVQRAPLVAEATAVIGAHVGPGALAAAVVSADAAPLT